MNLKVYNTATRSIDAFKPFEQGKVRVYACGPTIYDHAHIGNFRSFLFFDLVHRYLEWCGYEVRFVMNLTDVDDKVIKAASREGVSAEEHTRPFAEIFLADSTILGIQPADIYPRATKYIDSMVDFVERLVASEHAYPADDGAVYFAIESFPGYGKLKGIDTSTLKIGARIEHD